MWRTWTSALLVLAIGAAAAHFVSAGQSGKLPTFVVPAVPDVTIKIRRSIDHPDSTIVIDTLYLKGAWRREERLLDFHHGLGPQQVRERTTITRCDERCRLDLNDDARTYASWPIEDMTEHVRRFPLATGRAPQPVMAGADVKIVVDAVDTRERRQVGRYTARHVITTTTTTPGPGANARAGEAVLDGWYIDVPPADCLDWGEEPPITYAVFKVSGAAPDGVHVESRRTARRGFPVEEISRSEGDAAHPATRIALLELSEATLDPSRFNVPAGYRRALPRLTGGFEMTKPDTLPNHLEDYWEVLALWARSVFRF